MRQITIRRQGEVNIEGDISYTGHVRPKEQAKVSVEIKNTLFLCEDGEVMTGGIESCYLKCHVSAIHQLGQATSPLDCWLDIAFSLMVDEETAAISIILPEKYCEDVILKSPRSGKSGAITLTCTAYMKVIEAGRPIYQFTSQEKFAIALDYKNLGISLYKDKSHLSQIAAFSKFCDAVRWLVMIEKDNASDIAGEILIIKAQCYNNIALHHLHESHFNLAVAATSLVLLLDDKNVKALYRRAVANTELQNYEVALSDIQSAIVLEPGNKTVKQYEVVIKGRQKSVSRKYAAAMRQYFL
ncbi:hypothetical protein Pmani_017667 [Petrolisthes manimaculis]|uniref:Uncharacterized protein n=1 Tax=Petrolisthes manimaculis TaxID=1843537 RepID=A0AAE1PMY7_9EUCA|nr:hypothetical protein Pmani_017667 [Petrolisthes manimaculis]